MRIALLAQYYPPTENACANRMAAFAAGLRARGDEVTILCGMPNYPDGIKPPAYRGRWFVEETLAGVRVLRTYEFATANSGSVRRMLNYLSFMLSASCAGARLGPQDVLLVSTPPLFVAWSALRLRRRARCLVLDVRDLWPQSLIEIGHARAESPVVRWLAALERKAYGAADLILTATRGIERQIRDQLPARPDRAPPRVAFLPNGITPGMAPRPSAFRREPDTLTLLYAGNLSHAQDLLQYLAFLRRLQQEGGPLAQALRLVFAGDGELRPELERYARAHALRGVSFLGWIAREESYDVMRQCDACIVSLRDTPLFRGALPSKTFEYLYFERPVLTNVQGELREVLDEAGAGYFHAPHDYASFRAAAQAMLDDPAARAERGRRGRLHVLEHFVRDRTLDRLRELLLERLTHG